MSLSLRVSALGLLAATALGAALPAAAQTTFDAAGDFSFTNNPNGVWSYGTVDSTTGAFILDAIASTVADPSNANSFVQGWQDTAGAAKGVADVYKNTSATTFTAFGLDIPSGTLFLDPSSTGTYSTVRFTAPTTALYTVNAQFFSIRAASSFTPDSSDAAVFIEGARDPTFSTALMLNPVGGYYNDGVGPSPSYAQTLLLTAGETLDLAVGVGGDGSNAADGTGLSATITEAPEPSQTAALGLGAVGLGALALVARRRKVGA